MAQPKQHVVEIDEDSLPTERLAQHTAPIEYLITLRRKGLSLDQIASICHVTKGAISRRLSKTDEAIRMTDAFCEDRANILAWYQQRILRHLTEAKLRKASARDLVISMGVLFDKERLQRGQSTSNIAYADMVKAYQAKVNELKLLEESDK